MQTKTKSGYITIRDPYYLDNGSMIVDVTLTTNEPDRDNELVRPLGVKGFETAVICYNHKRCDGIPVSTGASFLPDSIVQTLEELRMQVMIKPTDQMFYCDVAGRKQTNGNLLNAVETKQVMNCSIGFRFNPEDVTKEYINGQLVTVYNSVILDELSLLDVISSNINSKIHNDMTIQTKCLECIQTNGMVGSFVISGDGKIIAQITEITDTEVKALDPFTNQVITLDDGYELVETPSEETLEDTTEKKPLVTVEKACACMLGKKPVKNITKEVLADITPVDPEELAEDLKLQTILDNQSAIMQMITDLTSSVTSLSSQIEAESKADVSADMKVMSDEIMAKMNKSLAIALSNNTVTKFLKADEIPPAKPEIVTPETPVITYNYAPNL